MYTGSILQNKIKILYDVFCKFFDKSSTIQKITHSLTDIKFEYQY